MPLIKHNIASNEQLYPSISLSSAMLDWEDDSASLKVNYPAGHDIIMWVFHLHPLLPSKFSMLTLGIFRICRMADVTYNTDIFPALLRTLHALLQIPRVDTAANESESTSAPSLRTSPLVVLAYKERDPGERNLFMQARKLGIVFELVDNIPGAGGMPVEIYIGGLL